MPNKWEDGWWADGWWAAKTAAKIAAKIEVKGALVKCLPGDIK